MSNTKAVKSWPGLFDLYQNEDGTFRAEFGLDTSLAWRRLTWGLDRCEFDVMHALVGFGAIPMEGEIVETPDPRRMGPFAPLVDVHTPAIRLKEQVSVYAHLARLLQRGLGSALHDLVMLDTPAVGKAAARQTVQKRIIAALDALERREQRETHRNTEMVEATLGGEPLYLPVACAALEYARMEVAKTQELPTKGTVRRIIETKYPQQSALAETTWRKVWKEAGLQKLPSAKAWTKPPKKGPVKQARTRTKSVGN